MSNSPLVTYTCISPFRNSPRNHEADTVSIHCTAGRITVQGLGALFQTKEASSNYGIGWNGEIGEFVPERDRSWCTDSRENDNRAITIEVASESYYPYAVSEEAYQALIKLLADICRRNPGIHRLRWQGDRSLIGQVDKQNMTVHRWFNSGKSCPGDYLYSRHGDIARRVNRILDEEENKVTYEEFKAFQERYEGEQAKKTASQWAKAALAYGKEHGIMVGNEKGNQMPQSVPNRQEVMMMLYAVLCKYRTVDDLPEWGKAPIQRMMDLGVVAGAGKDSEGRTLLNMSLAELRMLCFMERYFEVAKK